MTQQPTPTLRKISARDKILRAAMALDDDRGVQEHSVEELAASASVAKGSVYYHFGSKERLVQEMLIYGASELLAILEAIDAASPPAKNADDVHSQYRAKVTAAFEFLNANPSFTGLVAFAMARREAQDSEQLHRGKAAMLALITDSLARLEEASQQIGLPTHPTSADGLNMIATCILAAAVTLSIDRHTSHPHWSIQECVDALMRISLPHPAT